MGAVKIVHRADRTNKTIEFKSKSDIYDPSKPFNETTRSLIRQTHKFSDFPIREAGKRFKIEMDDHYLMECCDGMGTKGVLHWHMDTIEHGVNDAFWMTVDDLGEGGYRPLYLSDHILIQDENADKIRRMVTELTCLSKQNEIAMMGGETAIINTIQGFEIGINSWGIVKRDEEITTNVQDGDILIGIQSSGIHSNGISFYRENFTKRRWGTKRLDLDQKLPWRTTVGEELTIPTRGYLPATKELIAYLAKEAPANEWIHGMVHITGGGLSKLKELLPDSKNLDILVERNNSMEPHMIFSYANEAFKTSSYDMYRKFNNGIGYVIAIDRSRAAEALTLIRRHYPVDKIGEVQKGAGNVYIESKYEDKMVVY